MNTKWRMPSKYELNLMYENLRKFEIGGFANTFYLSSSENGADYAWVQSFSDGGQGFYGYKYYGGRVRAVRVFTTSTIYQLRSRGTMNGWIFHIEKLETGLFKYYEASQEDYSEHGQTEPVTWHKARNIFA